MTQVVYPSAINISTIKYNWRGEWASSTVYRKNDIVRYKGRQYYCTTDILSELNLAGPSVGPGIPIQGTVNSDATYYNTVPTTWVDHNNNGNLVLSNIPRKGQTMQTQSPVLRIAKIGGGGGWNASVRSEEGYAASAYCSARMLGSSTTAMFGLNSDPTTNDGYPTIDYAWYFDHNNASIYENGTSIGSFGSIGLTDILSITYDGRTIRYWKNGQLIRYVERAYSASTPLYFDSSLYSASTAGTQGMTDVHFGPGDSNRYWAEHTDGFLFRGGWMPYRQYYPGDVVTLRGDTYICKAANFNGHPIYKNGAFYTAGQTNPDWDIVADGTDRALDYYFEFLPNMPPLGWTKYRGSQLHPGSQRSTTMFKVCAASGRVYHSGRVKENGASGWAGWSVPTADGDQMHMQSLAFSHWDYRMGRLPGFQGQPPKCIQIVAAHTFCYFLFDNGELYATGYNGHGQIGDGTTTERGIPVRVGYVYGTHHYYNSGTNAGILATTRIVKIASGMNSDTGTGHAAAALDSEGRVWTWGYNGFGQLGHGDATNRTVPTMIDPKYFNDTAIDDIWYSGDDGYGSFYAIDVEGNVWSWGYNGYSQLGHSNKNSGNYIYRPARVPYNFNQFGGVKKIYNWSRGSYGGCMILTNDGSLHYAGKGYYDFGGPGSATIGEFSNFRRYSNVLKGYERALGQDVKTMGGAIDVCDNVDEFWVVGSGNMNQSIYLRERETGLLFSWGYNIWNSLMYNTNVHLVYNDSGGYNVNSYFPMIAAIDGSDITFVGRTGTNGYRIVYFVTESGIVKSTSSNGGAGGWGYDSVDGTELQIESGQPLDDANITTEANSGTWNRMRAHERVAIVGGTHYNTTYGAYVITQSGELRYIGYQDLYGPSGRVAYDSWDADNSYYTSVAAAYHATTTVI